MDLSLPGIDGWELARILKGDTRTAAIPIVALTAHALNGEQERALDAGCDAFVTKPCLPQALAANSNACCWGRPSGPTRAHRLLVRLPIAADQQAEVAALRVGRCVLDHQREVVLLEPREPLLPADLPRAGRRRYSQGSPAGSSPRHSCCRSPSRGGPGMARLGPRLDGMVLGQCCTRRHVVNSP